jgi:putative transcriptional regulator
MGKMFNDLTQGLSEVDAFLSGRREGFKVTVPEEINVKGIRSHLRMTQKSFSNCFGFSLDAIKHWEGGRRTPEAPVRAFSDSHSEKPEGGHDCSSPESCQQNPLVQGRTETKDLPIRHLKSLTAANARNLPVSTDLFESA